MRKQPSVEMVLILGILTALASLSIDMYLPSLPELGREYAADQAKVQTTLSAFFLGFALGQAFYGPIADLWGRKPPLYLGLGVFFLASAGCALSPNIETLAVLRFFQALGACAGGVIARAMVRDLFDTRDAPRIFASLMLVMGVAPMLAPILGGWVLTWFGWHAIFWVLAGIGAVSMVMVHFRLPESHVSYPGASPGWSVLLVYGRLLVDRSFMGYALAGGLSSAGLFAYISGSPFVFIELHGVPAQHFGWFFGINALGLIVAGQVNGRLLQGLDQARVLRMAQYVQGLAALTLVGAAATGWGGLWGIAVPLFIFLAAQGFIGPSAMVLAMAPQAKQAGMASALLGCLQFSVAALSSSLVGVLQDGSAMPMALVMLICAGLGTASLWLLPKR